MQFLDPLRLSLSRAPHERNGTERALFYMHPAASLFHCDAAAAHYLAHCKKISNSRPADDDDDDDDDGDCDGDCDCDCQAAQQRNDRAEES